ncbi:hypothetical protein Acr_15g0011980 [Actinidia rufa]|uniref:Uncharacterized protein n=1 Tax=Actinidia rufa TaxID=165716 RepID=A0A7J0FWR5_9ERIC|nr:hypothetical protein Acr_15g0011980 [Actinidia rufa]
MVQGSVSVVHQIHALGMSKCLKLIARVIRVVEDDCGEVRVVVLVDMYLPIGLWFGWQFPNSGQLLLHCFGI